MTAHKLVLAVALVALGLFSVTLFHSEQRAVEAACPPETSALQCATTTGTVTTAGIVPIIECKWELADMSTAAGFQYQDGPATLNDDDNTVVPDGNPGLAGDQPPCDLTAPPDPAAAANGPARMPNNIHRMIQVSAPNHLQNTPVLHRDIQLWLAAEPVNGITGVFWDVYEQVPAGTTVPAGAPPITCFGTPAGSPCWALKTQVHSNNPANVAQFNYGVTPVPAGFAHGGTPNNLDGVVTGTDCDAEGLGATAGNTTLTPNSMWAAAVGSGQLTNRAVTEAANNWGMVSRCLQQVKGLYSATFQLDKDQSCGEYKVVATVVASGASVSLTNYFDVICNFFAETDFEQIAWGNFNSQTAKVVVAGDLTWNACAPPAPPQGPCVRTNNMTIANGNNAAMGVRIRFDPMTGTIAGNLKTITIFDACFGRSAAAAQVNCADPIPACSSPPPAAPAPASCEANLSDAAAVNNATPPVAGTVNPNNYVLCANELGKLDVSLHPTGDLVADTYTGQVYVLGYAANPQICYGDIHPAGPPGPLDNAALP